MTQAHLTALSSPRLLHTVVLTLLAGAATAAQAQSEFYRPVTPPGVTQGGAVGAVLLVGREYRGSDESRTRLMPSLDYQWSNGWFAGVGNGVGFNASGRPDMAYGLRVTADFGRDESRSTALRGLGDVPARPELGGFFNLSPMPGVMLNSSLRYGSGTGRDGLLLDVGAGWSTPLSPRLRLGASVAATWANGAYQQSYFGVTAVQSAASGLPVYSAGAGLRDVRVGLSLGYSLTPEWTLNGSLSHATLRGDARVSTLVRERATTSAALVLARRF